MPAGFGASANVCPTDQATVLCAIVSALRGNIPRLSSEMLCFVSDTPWPDVETHDRLFCTVCPGSASFEADSPVGGAQHGIVEVGRFIVTVWQKLDLDELERAEESFLDGQTGLLTLKSAVLKALAGRQMYSGGHPLLQEHLRPVNSIHPPSRQHEDGFSSFSLVFDGAFFWDLSERLKHDCYTHAHQRRIAQPDNLQ